MVESVDVDVAVVVDDEQVVDDQSTCDGEYDDPLCEGGCLEVKCGADGN